MFYAVNLIFIASLAACVLGTPIVLRETSPSGETIVAVSSSDSDMDKYFARSNQAAVLQNGDYNEDTRPNPDPFSNGNGNFVQSISIAGRPAGGSARSFASASTSSGNPFLLPFFVPPNLDGFALNHWIRSFESFYEPNFAGNGKVVTAINDNGHVYGKINGIPFDNGVKSDNVM